MTDAKKSKDLKPSNIKGEVDVNEKNPWGDDALERQKFAQPLIDLVNSVEDAPFCIDVDGEWGSGKTFFLKRWCAEFSKEGKAIYFNAWRDDFYTDPLTAIIGQLWNELEKGKMKDIGNLLKGDWWNTVKKATLNLSYSGVKLGDFQSPARKTLKEYLEERGSIDILQKQLQELAGATHKKTERPLVFVVDELDRCRPTFAIELLERVKHIVGVPGIVFVFGINQKQLEESIRSVYGNIGAADYLRKFFDAGMILPQAEASKYCTYLIKKHKIDQAITKSPVHNTQYGEMRWKSDWPVVVNVIPTMLDYMGLSLRQTEQAIRMWLIILHSKEVAEKPGMYMYEGSLAFLILLRIKNRDMYKRFLNEECEPQEIMNYMLGFLPWEESRVDEYRKRKDCMQGIAWACYFFYKEEECPEIINEFEQASEAKSADELSQEYRYVPQKIIEIQNGNTRHDSIARLLSLIKHAKSTKWFQSPPSRQKVARFLEWGDNWRI